MYANTQTSLADTLRWRCAFTQRTTGWATDRVFTVVVDNGLHRALVCATWVSHSREDRDEGSDDDVKVHRLVV